jgi:hypothetical protein
MWSRAAGISNEKLTNFTIANDLKLVRAGPTTYGVILLGKIQLPEINDEQGKGYIHVRIHDPPNRVSSVLYLYYVHETDFVHFDRELRMSYSTPFSLTRERETTMERPRDM